MHKSKKIRPDVAAEIERLIVTLMKDRSRSQHKPALTMAEWKALLEHLVRMATEKE